MRIPFNRPYATGKELGYIAEAHAAGHLSGDGEFTRRCHAWLERRCATRKALLTHSCTAALELAALLLDLKPGDEVIMPSYTFVSTANAFVLRGAVPVFVDVREDTGNIDENLIEAAIGARTRAICVVHYAGVACDMDAVMAIAARHGLRVVEDAAQGILADYQGRPLGSIGHLGALSFHETKNLHSGEGGALLVNDPALVERAEILREKGTNRSRFFRGEVDKYCWVDLGSSYLPSEVNAAFLYAQLEEAEAITARRLALWQRYHAWAGPLEAAGLLRRPRVPDYARHNGHIYPLRLPDRQARSRFIEALAADGIQSVFHYLPLHDSPAGWRYARAHGALPATARLGDGLVRLPLWLGLEDAQEEVCARAARALAHA